jgi:hypothetical protein
MAFDSDEQQIGAISYGGGQVVLPGPKVDATWNLATRDYEDRTFRWKQVVGLEPTPDQGYELTQAASYLIQITPDLGWPNVESMFEPYVDSPVALGNARLIAVGPIEIDDLTQIEDETVTYSVPLDTMKAVLAPAFSRYLWRVLPISQSGVIGSPSSIQTFIGRVIILSTEWTVDALPEFSAGLGVTLTGRKSPGIARIEINGTDQLTLYPNNETWNAEFTLHAGRNIFDIRAIDAQGNTSEYRRVETFVEYSQPATFEYYNRFDDFGAMLDLPRLPGEKNHPYRERIKDVMVHRASCTYPGLLNGILRELDLSYDDEAIYLEPGIDSDTQRAFTDIYVWLDVDGLHIVSPRYRVYSEYHEINPNTRQIRITNKAPLTRIVLEQPRGQALDPKTYTVEADGLVTLLGEVRLHDPVYVSYNYYHTISATDKTVAEFIDAINDFEVEGNQQIVAEMGDNMTSSAPASGLQQFRRTFLSAANRYTTAGEVSIEGRMPIRWTEIELYALMDPKFKDRYLNTWGSRFNTAYDAWAMGMKSLMHTTWGYLVADDNVWSHPEIRVSGLGTLETVFDANPGYWVSPATGRIYSMRQAAANGMVDPGDGSALGFHGIPWVYLRSGVGDSNDLLVFLTEQPGDIGQEVTEQLTIVSSKTGIAEDLDLGLGTISVDSATEVS